MLCGDSIVFGYRVVNKRVEVNEDEANIVRYIFDQYAHGRQAKDILNELTAQGIGKRNKPFPINTFYSILHNPKYIGIAHSSDGIYTNIYPPSSPKNYLTKCRSFWRRISAAPAAKIRITFWLENVSAVTVAGTSMLKQELPTTE